MLAVDGNPLQDIKATEAISFVIFKGERINGADLFAQDYGPCRLDARLPIVYCDSRLAQYI